MLTDEAIHFVNKHKEEPFFLYLAHYAPHEPHQAPEEDIEIFRKAGIENEEVAAIYGMIHRMDKGVGRLLDELEKLGLDNNTIVLFTSDNGPQFYSNGDEDGARRFNCGFRGFKDLVYEGGIRVPMIIRAPGLERKGVSCHETIHFTDWFPTLLTMAGIEVPKKLKIDGRSVLSIINGTESTGAGNEREICWQFSRYKPVLPPPLAPELYNMLSGPLESRCS